MESSSRVPSRSQTRRSYIAGVTPAALPAGTAPRTRGCRRRAAPRPPRTGSPATSRRRSGTPDPSPARRGSARSGEGSRARHAAGSRVTTRTITAIRARSISARIAPLNGDRVGWRASGGSRGPARSDRSPRRPRRARAPEKKMPVSAPRRRISCTASREASVALSETSMARSSFSISRSAGRSCVMAFTIAHWRDGAFRGPRRHHPRLALPPLDDARAPRQAHPARGRLAPAHRRGEDLPDPARRAHGRRGAVRGRRPRAAHPAVPASPPRRFLGAARRRRPARRDAGGGRAARTAGGGRLPRRAPDLPHPVLPVRRLSRRDRLLLHRRGARGRSRSRPTTTSSSSGAWSGSAKRWRWRSTIASPSPSPSSPSSPPLSAAASAPSLAPRCARCVGCALGSSTGGAGGGGASREHADSHARAGSLTSHETGALAFGNAQKTRLPGGTPAPDPTLASRHSIEQRPTAPQESLHRE